MAQDPRQSFSTHYQQQQSAVTGHNSPTSLRQRDTAYPPPKSSPAPKSGTAIIGGIAGGSILVLAALGVTPNLKTFQLQPTTQEKCIKIEQDQKFVSRDQLRKLLSIQPPSPKGTVREVLNHPHCVLASTLGENGVPTEREAYPLEFDPNTWLVVLYEHDQYTGYSFSFRQ